MLTFDLRDFERAAASFAGAARQVPFALARSLNDGVTAARKELVENTWPSHVKVRNRAFLGAALRREFARKTDLRAAVVESGPAAGRGGLTLHARGGTKRPRGANLAIPGDAVKGRRTGKGVPKGLRPTALPDSFKRGDAIYQRVGPKKRQIKLMYTLRASAEIKAEVPFQADFERVVNRVTWQAFRPRLAMAFASRRR